VIVTPTAHGFVVGGQATLVDDTGTMLRAWAERYVRHDPDIRWIVGNYVEADQANNNGHIFPLTELVAAQATIPGKPLNMLHRERHIVGYFAGAQLLDAAGSEYQPKTTAGTVTFSSGTMNCTTSNAANTLAAAMQRPYIEALAGIWHSRFPDEFFEIQRAHKEGTLFFSMEAVPEAVSCPTCSRQAVFAGFESDEYCAHMQGITGPKILHKPVFAGGAIIIPPVRPGWDHADVKSIASDQTEATYADITEEFPHLTSRDWEWMMAQVLELARDVGQKERKDLADKGKALPDGSFPIKTVQDLKNAIQAVGRAKNPAAAKAHIKKMAKKLGADGLIPEGW
jgi:hypothetical protein